MLNVTDLLAVLAKSRAFINGRSNTWHGDFLYTKREGKSDSGTFYLVDACANGPSLLTPTPELRKAYDHEDNITC